MTRLHPGGLGALLVLAASALLAGCSATIEEYAGAEPALDLAEYFNGPLVAHGMVQDRSGKVIRRFRVDMTGTWEGDEGTLEEHFTYADGETQTRTWRFTKVDEHRYTGTASDVVGEARGVVRGNALHWEYVLRVPARGSVWDLKFEDWMFLLDDGVMINRARMSKLGIELGQVTLFFRKLDPAPDGSVR